MNKVELTGRVVHPVELKTTQKGQKMLSNSIAVLRPFKDLDGKYGVDFINFTLFDNKAENFAKYVEKGDGIELICRLLSKTKEHDGNKIYTIELVVEHVGYLFGKRGEKESE